MGPCNVFSNSPYPTNHAREKKGAKNELHPPRVRCSLRIQNLRNLLESMLAQRKTPTAKRSKPTFILANVESGIAAPELLLCSATPTVVNRPSHSLAVCLSSSRQCHWPSARFS